jgi:hypothetical protein
MALLDLIREKKSDDDTTKIQSVRGQMLDVLTPALKSFDQSITRQKLAAGITSTKKQIELTYDDLKLLYRREENALYVVISSAVQGADPGAFLGEAVYEKPIWKPGGELDLDALMGAAEKDGQERAKVPTK